MHSKNFNKFSYILAPKLNQIKPFTKEKIWMWILRSPSCFKSKKLTRSILKTCIIIWCAISTQNFIQIKVKFYIEASWEFIQLKLIWYPVSFKKNLNNIVLILKKIFKTTLLKLNRLTHDLDLKPGQVLTPIFCWKVVSFWKVIFMESEFLKSKLFSDI